MKLASWRLPTQQKMKLWANSSCARRVNKCASVVSLCTLASLVVEISKNFDAKASDEYLLSQSYLPLQSELAMEGSEPVATEVSDEFVSDLGAAFYNPSDDESDLEEVALDIQEQLTVERSTEIVGGIRLLPVENSFVELFGESASEIRNGFPSKQPPREIHLGVNRSHTVSHLDESIQKAAINFRALVSEGLRSSEFQVEPRFGIGFDGMSAQAAKPRFVEPLHQDINFRQDFDTKESVRKLFSLNNSQSRLATQFDPLSKIVSSLKLNETSNTEVSTSAIAAQKPVVIKETENIVAAASFSEVVKVRIVAPEGTDFTKIRFRISGTQLDFTPDAAGYLQVSGIHSESKARAIVWDEDSRFARRIVALDFSGSSEKELEISLISRDLLTTKSAAFGTFQSFSKSGFCALVSAAKVNLYGSKLTVYGVDSKLQYPVYVYGENGFPKSGTMQGVGSSELSSDGRFCVFNVDSDLVEVKVKTPQGILRSFVVSQKASTFADDLIFDLDSVAYPKVQPVELVDSSVVLEKISEFNAENSVTLPFGDKKNVSWFAGLEVPTWANVKDVSISGDLNYSSKMFTSENDFDSRVYSPNSDMFSEFFHSQNLNFSEVKQTFSLVARNVINAAVASGKPLRLPVLNSDLFSDFERVFEGKSEFDETMGVGFLNLDLEKVKLQYSELRVKIVDNWTGESVGRIHFLPAFDGVKNPRFVRAVFGDLPIGDYSLIVADKVGAVKWIEMVRARSSAVQVINFQDL